MTTTRLIIITVPPPPAVDYIQRLRQPMCETYRATWALTYPPHVTLRTGVRVPEDQMAKFLKEFGDLLDDWPSFPIRTGPVTHSRMEYEGARKFFVYFPVITDAPIVELNRHLLTYTRYRKSEKTDFQPHVTLLWDDLQPEHQADITTLIAQDHRFHSGVAWWCDQVALYIQQGEQWVPFHIFPLV